MNYSATESTLGDVLGWRDAYRQEMNCQIIHDSIHTRNGWTREYLLREETTPMGYGSVAVAGPWKEKPTIYEFYVTPPARVHAFKLFEALLGASGAVGIETQSNDPQLTVMLHLYGRDVVSESVLFQDQTRTHDTPPEGALFRRAMPDDAAQIAEQKLDSGAKWLLEVDGEVAATGDILFHYNRPYGDIYMAVAERFRRRGLGGYLVQELKRVCYEKGDVPAARCNPSNIASRATLAKAGFVPCGHILVGRIR